MAEPIRVTAESTRLFFDSTGLICINSLCSSEQITITAFPGSSAVVSREKFHCRDCDLEWLVELAPSKIENIRFGMRVFTKNQPGEVIENEVFFQSNNPEVRIKEAIKELLKSMMGPSLHARGKALSELAAIARVDLTQLRGSPSEEPQSLPSEDS